MKLAVPPGIREDDLHAALVQWLRYQKINGLWWHTANTHSSVQFATKLKRLGMRPGVFDLQFLHVDGYPAFIELKTRLGRLTESQREFREFLLQNGIRHAILRSDDTALIIAETERHLRWWRFL